MLKDVALKYYFDQNFNCAETIVRAGNEYYNLGLHDNDMKLVAAFGAGIQTGSTCGALLSGASMLSMLYVTRCAHESADIKPVTTMLTRRFRERMGGILCTEVKPKFFQPGIRCQHTVEAACDLLEEVINEYNAKKAAQAEA